MKKIAITIVAILITSFATIVNAAPKSNTWYTGSKLGWSRFYNTEWHDKYISNNGSTDKNQLGISAFGGYQVNPYIGLEADYDWLGNMLYKGDITSGMFKAQGVQLTTKFNYPVSNNSDIYVRLGGIIWHADSENSIIGNNHNTGISPVFAGGIERSIISNVAARLEYQWINNINSIFINPNNGILNFGISYRFNQLGIIPKDNLINNLVSETKTNSSNLKTNILFNFDEANLKAESKQILDQLCNQLNKNLKDKFIVVLGYTDCIGSNVYNQRLSEKRAKNVVNYLIQKGIPSNRISIHSMDKNNSVTGHFCNNIKDRIKLINCLTPDRRVEIEVKSIENSDLEY